MCLPAAVCLTADVLQLGFADKYRTLVTKIEEVLSEDRYLDNRDTGDSNRVRYCFCCVCICVFLSVCLPRHQRRQQQRPRVHCCVVICACVSVLVRLCDDQKSEQQSQTRCIRDGSDSVSLFVLCVFVRVFLTSCLSAFW